MGEITGIEWTDHTFNPWIGCTPVSGACDHCYAESLAKRYGWATWGAGEKRVRTSAANWQKPLAWNRKAAKDGTRPRVFCASLADVFDAEVEHAWRVQLLDLIEATANLDWLLLTKRPKVAADFFASIRAVPSNIWIGTTVEDQKMADLRVPILLSIPAKVRFLSCEPLLGPVDLGWIQAPRYVPEDHEIDWKFDALSTGSYYEFRSGDYRDSGDGPEREHRIDWVIAGGESGPKARPSHPDWFRVLRDQCKAAGVPFFFKQWGEWLPTGGDGGWYAKHPVSLPLRVLNDGQWTDDGNMDGEWMARVGKKAAGATLDGREHREFPR